MLSKYILDFVLSGSLQHVVTYYQNAKMVVALGIKREDLGIGMGRDWITL